MCPPGTGVGPRSRSWFEADPPSATIVVLAVAVAAVHADGAAVRVGSDDGMHPVGLAGTAEVFDRFAGAVTSCVHVGCYDRTDSGETHNEP